MKNVNINNVASQMLAARKVQAVVVTEKQAGTGYYFHIAACLILPVTERGI
jgi:hypothetical protein